MIARVSGLRVGLGPLVVLVAACGQPRNEVATRTDSVAPAADMTPTAQLLLASASVALPPPGIGIGDLPDSTSAGARMLQSYCVTCHSLPSPAMHSATDWPSVVRRMWLRMDLLDPQYAVPKPELGERIVLLDYLTTNALKVSRANLPDAPGRQFFVETCAQCHELPDPSQHSAEDWFVTVRRMNDHMRAILGRELTPAQIDEVSRFLSTAAM
jgi:mono/diheme cytochrome c family protein